MRPVRANSETVAIERATQPVKWMSRNGNVSALAVRIAMIAALRTLAGLEARADQWHSTRKYGRNAVAMRMGFENWAIAHPRTIEWTMFALSVFVNLCALLLAPHQSSGICTLPGSQAAVT